MDEINIPTPGERLKNIRKKLGLRQQDLVCKSLSKNCISMFENNKRRINIVNASHISEKVNNIAKQKGIRLKISASYFIKNSSDVAKERCLNWLEEIEYDKKGSICDVYFNLYKCIFLSSKYDLDIILAQCLYIKGFYLYMNKLYSCAVVNFSKALVYFSKHGHNEDIRKIYIMMAKIYYIKKDYYQSLSYFNLAGYIKVDEDIYYYKALCFYKLKKYKLAKHINDKIIFKNNRCIDLSKNIQRELKK